MKMRSIMIIVVVLLLGIGAAVLAQRYINKRYELTPTPNAPPPAPARSPSQSANPPSQTPLPPTLLLKVPFTPQAPTANWDELHNEACEEASVIMANAYYNNNDDNDKNQDGNLDPAYVEAELEKITEWENEHFGYYLDINSKETVEVIKNVYGLQAEVNTDYTEEDIKQALTQNKLVLLPAQGQQLGNPNYRRPGPPYHMLVIKGYTKDGFVTNDPGTRRGASYPYTFDVLYNANGDWNHDTHSVDTNKKTIIVVWK